MTIGCNASAKGIWQAVFVVLLPLAVAGAAPHAVAHAVEADEHEADAADPACDHESAEGHAACAAGHSPGLAPGAAGAVVRALPAAYAAVVSPAAGALRGLPAGRWRRARPVAATEHFLSTIRLLR